MYYFMFGVRSGLIAIFFFFKTCFLSQNVVASNFTNSICASERERESVGKNTVHRTMYTFAQHTRLLKKLYKVYEYVVKTFEK